MKKFSFKQIVIALLIVSLSCNALLMYQVFLKPTKGSGSISNSNNITQSVNVDVKSNITEVVKKAQSSTVGVAVYQSNQFSGSGSGVVYKVDGKTVYIITNHHVIENADKIEVVFANNESVTATLVGSDKYGDIAVLKMSVDFNIEPFDIGDSDLLDAGETVLAIGSPLSIENAGTVTQGIVSSPYRSVSIDLNNDNVNDWDINVIQTDAAINAGNSGGALINAAGELVGITSMKLTSTSIEGVCYAYPINDTLKLVDEIMDTGKVTRPVLGVSAVALNDYNSYQLYMFRLQTGLNTGVYVYNVQLGSAASLAGIKSGDVILKIDDKDIDSYKDFITTLYSHKVGDTIQIELYSQGNNKKVSVTLK